MDETRKNLYVIDEKKIQLDRWNLMVAEHLSSDNIEIPVSLMNHYTSFKQALSEYISAWDNALPVYTMKGPEAADKIMKEIEGKVGRQIYILATEFRRIAYEELDRAMGLSRSAMIITLITVIISAIVAICVSMILSGKINKPILNLKNAADEISHGYIDKPLKPISQDELGDLTVSFDRMRMSFKKIVDRFEKNSK